MIHEKMGELSIDERRDRIQDILGKEGKVKVAELSRLFGISEVTIRNDLSDMEREGLLERVHGGAISTYRAYFNMTLNDRARTNVEEKKRIAQETVRLISDGDTLMMNAGTTTLFVLQELKYHKNITTVTNSVSIAQEAGRYPNMQVILLGGNLNAQYQFVYGDDTICQLKRYRADKLILAVDGASAGEGISTYHHLEAEVNRQMIQRVNKTIAIADFTKIGRISFSHIDSIDSIDMLITNVNAGQKEVEKIMLKGPEVRLV